MMKKALLAIYIVCGVVTAYGLVYLYAYHRMDIDKISGYAALPADPMRADPSFVDVVLGPVARYHGRTLAEESAHGLIGRWELVDNQELEGLVPRTLNFSHISGRKIAVKPSISSEGIEINEFEISQWIRSDYPAGLFTGTSISISLLSDDEIELHTREMNPFGLGAEYRRIK